MKKEEDGIYTKLTNEDSEMEMFHEQSWWDESKPIIFAFGIVVVFIVPWCVGAAMLAKWFIF